MRCITAADVEIKCKLRVCCRIILKNAKLSERLQIDQNSIRALLIGDRKINPVDHWVTLGGGGQGGEQRGI